MAYSPLESLSNSLLKPLSKRTAHSSAYSLPFPKLTRQTKRARSSQQDIEDPPLSKILTYPKLSLPPRTTLSSLQGTSVNPFLKAQTNRPEILLQTFNAERDIKAMADNQPVQPPQKYTSAAKRDAFLHLTLAQELLDNFNLINRGRVQAREG